MPAAVKAPAGSSSVGLEWVMIVGGGFMAIGSFLPWWHETSGFSVLDRNGMQLGNAMAFSWDGLVVLLLGVVIALVGITNLTRTPFPRWISRSPIILGAVGLILAISNYSSISQTDTGLQSKNPSGTYSIGFGLWMVIIGSGLVLVFGVLAWISGRRARRAAP
jgi:hypothetical protein